MSLLAFLEIPTFTGLPAHPFFNRIAMYLVPTSIAVVLLALRPRWRNRLTTWAFALSIAALLSVQLTMGAGEVMDNVVHGDANPLVEEHESWSKLLRIGLIVQVLAAGALFRSVRRAIRCEAASDHDGVESASATTVESPAPVAAGRSVFVSGAVTAVVALVVAGLTVMTAHSGSKSVYQEDGEIMTGETGTDVAPTDDRSESTGG
ncbi:MAG: hypothetical protein ACK5CE_06290 [Actinomycetes bacterium]